MNLCSFDEFTTIIFDYYKKNKRSFAWRDVPDPYKVVVSEIMLQQTQTTRVIAKFDQFIALFDSFQALADASTKDVLTAWQGLGYNRRALALHAIAKKIITDHDGLLPSDPIELQKLPGIGKATAGSIAAFAFNTPTLFIETNIRTVYIHFFAGNQDAVKDDFIMTLLAQTLPADNARQWYYALMDYGVYLKSNFTNPSRRSAHYTTQSTFEGSDRQIRGMIIKILTNSSSTLKELYAMIDRPVERIDKALASLLKDGFIALDDQIIKII